MRTDQHVGEDAELYALGALPEAERVALEEHIASCEPCLRRVGEAEDAAAFLASGLPRYAPSAALGRRIAASADAQPRSLETLPARHAPERTRARSPLSFIPLAAAAAVALTVGSSWYAVERERRAFEGTEVALATVVHGHFFHASLATTPAGGELAAKVLYARDGSWLYLLIDHPMPGLLVSAVVDGKERDLGSPTVEGRVGTLFVTGARRPSAVVVRAGSSIVARAALPYKP